MKPVSRSTRSIRLGRPLTVEQLEGRRLLAGLALAADSDVPAGKAAFLELGSPTGEFSWSDLFFFSAAHTPGVIFPLAGASSVSVTLPDGTVNTVSGELFSGNWVDGPGFDGPGGIGTADLAISGAEDFDLTFETGHRSVGFAVITGTTNGSSSSADMLGATFDFTAVDELNNEIGTVSHALAADQVDQAWITLSSTVPFTRVEIRERVKSATDQYFSNILTSVEEVQVVTKIDVAIDIRPESDANRINLRSQGGVPVAILSTAAFDATTVDPLTVRLANAAVRLRGNGSPQTTQDDVNGDGFVDLVLHIDTAGLQLTEGAQTATLTGETVDGILVEGTDFVKVNGTSLEGSLASFVNEEFSTETFELPEQTSSNGSASLRGITAASVEIVAAESLVRGLGEAELQSIRITLDSRGNSASRFMDTTPHKSREASAGFGNSAFITPNLVIFDDAETWQSRRLNHRRVDEVMHRLEHDNEFDELVVNPIELFA